MSEALLAARRRRMLAAMGIDVWRRRDVLRRRVGAVGATAGRDRPENPPPAAAPTSSATPSVPAEAGAAAAAVHLDLLALAGPGGVVVGHFATPEERRIAQGVYFAVAGGSPEEPATARFQWPPPATSMAGRGAATTACRAFLEGQVDRTRAACLVLLGDAEHDGLPDPERVDVPVVRGPAARDLRLDPALKQALWRQIAAMKRR